MKGFIILLFLVLMAVVVYVAQNEDLITSKNYQKETNSTASIVSQSSKEPLSKQIQEKTSLDKLSLGPNDFALECRRVNDGSGMNNHLHVLIYTEKYSIGKFGVESKDGLWEPSYRINSRNSNLQEIFLSVTSYDFLVAQKINPSFVPAPEKITINRQSLKLIYETQGQYVGYIRMNYDCDILSDSKLEIHVQQILNNTANQVRDNKI